MSPVHYASQVGNDEVVGVLLMQHMQLVNNRALGGRTALHFASASADHHEVRMRARLPATAERW